MASPERADDARKSYDGVSQHKGGEEWKFRPKVKKPLKDGSRFCVDDKVCISTGRSLQGPYLIASVPEPKKYTLSLEDGTQVEDGKVYNEDELEDAS